MTLRTSLLLVLLALAAGSARADCDRDSDCKGGRVCVANKCIERKYCMKDKDCPGDQMCDRNSCVAPAGSSAPAPSTGYGGSSREQSAAQDAGMALLYTRNTWPVSIADRPLMVAPGMTEIQLFVDRDFSAEPPPPSTASHPLTSELFARFGVSDRIHAVLDSVGVCFVDCDPAGAFRFISGYLGYALVANHDMNLVTQFGFGLSNVIDAQAFTTGNITSTLLATAIPSVLFGWRVAPGVQIFSSAAIFLGFVGRDQAAFPDNLGLHLEPRIQLGQRLTLAPFIGYITPFSHSEFHQVPVGVGLYFVPDRALDIGAIFQLLDAFSHNVAPAAAAAPVNVGGTDGRSGSVFVTFRL